MSQNKALSKKVDLTFKYSFLLPQYWLIWLGILLLSLYQFLPKLIKTKISRSIGLRTYRKNHKRRHIVETNLKICFPNEDTQTLAKQFFIARTYIWFDSALLWWSSKKKLQSEIQINNSEHLQHCKKQRVIFLTCHNLALEYGAIALNFHLPVIGLINSFRNPLVNWLINRSRTRFNIKLADRNDGIRPIIKAIKEENAFYYLPDEDSQKSKMIYADFFGHSKATLSSLNKLAKLSDAIIIPCYTSYNFEKQHYQVNLSPPLTLPSKSTKTEDAAFMNRELEKLILIQKEQYMWSQRLFNTQQTNTSVY
ncbi:MAG: hypothetical protein ISR69_10625 [Gammaproteobacteria bacterium]|nr:hypothetical protein [Gammaproteobacteria bacterium]